MKMRLLSYGIIAALCIFKGTWAGLFLSPQPAFAVENGMISFNFTATEHFSIVGINSFTTIDFNNRCTASGSLTDTDRYQYNCVGNSTLIFTVSNLTRKDHTSFWTFFDLGSVNSLFAILYINVTVGDVTLSTNLTESDKKGVAEVKENASLEINCTSSDAFPNASVFLIGHDIKNDIYYTYPYTHLVNIRDIGKYFYTLAVYILALNRTTRSLTFYCKANNTQDSRVESRNLSVEVLFPPDGPPSVLQFASEYTVIEKQTGHLTCSINDSKPPTHLTWTCNGILQNNESSKADNVANLTWTAQRNTVTRCTCLSSYESTTYGNVSLRIVTLFPANITKLKLNGTTSDVDIQDIKMIEYSSVNIEWVTEGNPQPVFEWTEHLQNVSRIKPTDTTNASYSILNVDRSRNGTLCKFQATNNMEDSDGRIESRTVEKSLILIVLYPPDKEMSNVTLIEGNEINISCESGNVDDLFVKWSSQTNNGTTLNLPKVMRSDSGWFSCEVSYNMTSSFGDIENGSIAKAFYLDVLYPPEEIKVNSTTNRNLEVDDKIQIIHNDVVKLFCYASGKPIPVEYEWSGLNSSKSNVIVVKGNKDESGNITCHAYNNMTEQPTNTSVRGTANRSFIVDVLYPPNMRSSGNLSVLEGDLFYTTCLVQSGRMTSQSVRWLSQTEEIFSSNYLILANISRRMSGVYTCLLNYTLVPTYGSSTAQQQEKSIFLDVLYPPENVKILLSLGQIRDATAAWKFSVVENSALLLNCSAEGKPKPISFTWPGVSTLDSAILHLVVSRRLSGNLTCTARNYLRLTYRTNHTLIGTTNKTHEIEVLYSPQVIDFSVLHFVEGTDVKLDCLYDPGRTTTAEVCWQKGNKTVSCNRLLFVTNATREDTGVYHCTVHFSMKPTFGKEVAMSLQTGVLLQVENRSENLQVVSEVSSTAVIVGGTLAGIVVIAVVAIVVAYFIRTRKQPLTSGEDVVAYQNISSAQIQGSETVSEMNSANIYNELHSIGYEVLDNEYQELSSIADHKITEKRKVYETVALQHEDCEELGGDFR